MQDREAVGDGWVTRRDLIRVAAGTGGLGLMTVPPAGAADGAGPTTYTLPRATAELTPFRVEVPQAALDDLKRRLAATRFPERETVANWDQGVPLASMRELVEYWHDRYDWRRFEARINAVPQFRTELDECGIHFLHARSRHEGALPLLLTHGWPGSVVEFLKVVGPLTDPEAHGGRAEDAFHLVIPSLPGFGFSDKPAAMGWDVGRIARAWAALMGRLGYRRWVAQGGDWGGYITTKLGQDRPPGLLGIHLNYPLVFPNPIPTEGLSPNEGRAVAAAAVYKKHRSGYNLEQATRPQTIGYALADSPAGQAAWIYEKFQEWTDNPGVPEAALTRDEMLDNITLYWLTDTAASSARIYWENPGDKYSYGRVELPVGATVFPREIFRAPRSWAEKTYANLIYWNEVDRGGHFAAFEQPDLFARELRAAFRSLRARD